MYGSVGISTDFLEEFLQVMDLRQLRLFLYISRHNSLFGSEEWAYLDLPTLYWTFGMQRRTVERVLRQLADWRLVEFKHETGDFYARLY